MSTSCCDRQLPVQEGKLEAEVKGQIDCTAKECVCVMLGGDRSHWVCRALRGSKLTLVFHFVRKSPEGETLRRTRGRAEWMPGCAVCDRFRIILYFFLAAGSHLGEIHAEAGLAEALPLGIGVI